MDWLLPPSVSTYGPQIDQMYYAILIITGIVFVLTELTLIWFLIRYRHREGRKAAYVHGNVKAEVVWTVIPFVIVVGIALASRGTWAQIRDQSSFPRDALRVEVTAKQFEWNVSYAGADGEAGTDDDYAVRNQLHVPVGRPVVVTLRSEDVIHSFFLPDFRVKQDAVPGMEIPVWFEATETGEFPIGCAELCGIGHYRMRGSMTVHSAEEFASWEGERMAEVASRAGRAVASAGSEAGGAGAAGGTK